MNGDNQFGAVLSRTESWHAVTETMSSPEEIVMKTPFHIDMMVSWLHEDTEMTAGNTEHSIIGTAALHFVSNVPSTCTVMLCEGDPPQPAEFDNWTEVRTRTACSFGCAQVAKVFLPILWFPQHHNLMSPIRKHQVIVECGFNILLNLAFAYLRHPSCRWRHPRPFFLLLVVLEGSSSVPIHSSLLLRVLCSHGLQQRHVGGYFVARLPFECLVNS